MRSYPRLAACAAIVTVTACTESERRGPEGQIEVQIGAKAIEDGGFANACFDVEIRTLGGGGEGGKPYVTRGEQGATYPDDETTLCTNDIGGIIAGGRKAFSTALPCIDGETEVMVRLDSLWERNPAWEDGSDEPEYLRVTEFFDPCGPGGCVQRVQCKALDDVPAFFAIQVARPMNVGFTDVLISIGDLACAAKFDCEYPSEEGDPRPIQLLPHEGKLVDTGVMAVACSGMSEQASTYFNLTDMTVSCSDPDVEEPSLLLAVAANKYQFVFGSQRAAGGARRGFYTRVEGKQLGLAKELVGGNRTFIPVLPTEAPYGTTNNPAVIGYTADLDGSNRRLAAAAFYPGATGPRFEDLDLPGVPVGVNGPLVVVENGEDVRFYHTRTGHAPTLKLNTDNGPLTNCGDSAQLPSGLLVATCKFNGNLGVYAWAYEPDVASIGPIELGTGNVTLSDNTTLHNLNGGLYAINKDEDKAVRWTAGSSVGVPLAVALKSPEVIGDYIVNKAIGGTYAIIEPATETVYSASADLTFTGVEFRYQTYLCLQSGQLKACHFDAGTLVATTVTDTYSDGIATITDVQEIRVDGLPGAHQYAFYLVLGVAIDTKPFAFYLRMDIAASSPIYEVLGAEALEEVTGNEFLKGDELGGALQHPWTVTQGGNVKVGGVSCKPDGTGCKSELRAFTALPTSSSILALDNDPSILSYGSEGDPYKCNWGVTEYGTLGAPETYMACMVGLPSCPNATFTVTLCPSEEPLVCDQDTETFGYPDNWWPSCISWEIALTDADGERTCTSHPLAMGGTGVSLMGPRPSEELAFTRQLVEPRTGDGGTGTTEWFTACEPEPEPAPEP